MELFSIPLLLTVLCASASLQWQQPNQAVSAADWNLVSSDNSNNATSLLFPLSIVHWNDFHARFDDINNRSAHCGATTTLPETEPERCFGGYARIVTVVRRLMAERHARNPIYLNAGDNFQGTFWYNVGRWNVTAQFLNLLPADAIAIGNHEFSHRIAGLVPFFRALKSPVLAANVDAAAEPDLHGLFRSSIVVTRFARPIGIVGVTLANMPVIASTGRLRFTDPIAAVQREAARLRQQHNVRIVVVLSHCGIDTDYQIARFGGPDIDVVVGGHTHTLMYSGGGPVPNGERPRDVYPAVVRQPGSGRRVLIVQASAYTRWVGDLQVLFDDGGEVAGWRGNPVFVDETIDRDSRVVAQLKPWRDEVRKAGAEVLGVTRAALPRDLCFRGECGLGNLLADASVLAFTADVSLCLLHAGTTRNSLTAGNITLGDLHTAFPYENTMDYLQLSGRHLRAALEHSVSRRRTDTVEFVAPAMLQVSADVRVVFNVSRPVGERVVGVEVRGQPLQSDRMYGIVVPSFLVEGGDGFAQFGQYGRKHEIGPRDIDILTEYIREHSPLEIGITDRIQIVH